MTNEPEFNLRRGLWAAVPTPFQRGGSIDYGLLEENCARLARAGVDGIYTTDSDGEFYAIEFAEFKELANAFGRIVQKLRIPAQMGVTWINTRGAIDRLKASRDAGVPVAHVGLPFFMPLTMSDVERFFGDLSAAVPDGHWVYYAHPTCQPLLKGRDLAQLARLYPRQLVGSKVAAYELNDLSDVLVHTPQLAHFVGERNLLFAARLGARGCCSYWVNTMPAWTRAFVDACLAGDDRAVEMHRKFHRWETVEMAELRQRGYRHGIMGKARSALSGFLQDDGSTRPPYQPVPPELVAALRPRFRDFWQEELAREPFVALTA